VLSERHQSASASEGDGVTRIIRHPSNLLSLRRMLLPDSLLGWVVALAAAALVWLLLQSEDAPAAESAGGDAPTCRICYAGAEAGRLFTPCLCRGSMAHVCHRGPARTPD
jgi:hypothetical protein